MKSCIINFANGYWYENGKNRLLNSINAFKKETSTYDFLSFKDYSDIGSPHHKDLNYAFKFYSFKKALEMGYQNILWLDCSMYAIKNIDECFEHINNCGYAVTWSEYNNAQWTNDRTLEAFNMTRDEAEKTRHIYSGCFGISTNYTKFQEFYTMYETHLPYLNGAWNNNNKTESLDERCKGHRHDQTILSLILNKLEMDDTNGTFFEYWNSSENYKQKTCFIARGM